VAEFLIIALTLASAASNTLLYEARIAWCVMWLLLLEDPPAHAHAPLPSWQAAQPLHGTLWHCHAPVGDRCAWPAALAAGWCSRDGCRR
jgi:hypothetical protein